MISENKELLIRKVKVSDAPKLLELIENSGPFVSARSLSDYWLYCRFLSDTCLVAEVAGEITGVVIAIVNQSSSDEAYIQDLAVSPDSREKGLGAGLLAALEKALCDKGCSRVWLTSEPDNSTAMRLWAIAGFQNNVADYQDGDLWVSRDLKGPGKDRVVFEKSLKN